MAIDAVSISAIVVSVLAALGAFVKTVHLKKCHSACCDSDCTDKRSKTPPVTPVVTEPSRAILQLNEVVVTDV